MSKKELIGVILGVALFALLAYVTPPEVWQTISSKEPGRGK